MANVPLYQLTDIWNDSGIAWTSFSVDVTNTGSAAGSKLIDMKVGGVSQFAVGKGGELAGPYVLEKLTANRTYFIATTGNDTTGNGSSGTPWATIAKARDYIGRNLFLAGYTVELKLADGAYEGVVANGDGLPHINGGYVWIHGNDTNPENVVVSGTTQEGFGAGSGAYFFLSDLKIQSTVTAVIISSGGTIIFGRPAMGGWGGRLLIGRPQGASWANLISCYNGGYVSDGTSGGIEVDTGGISVGRIASVASSGYISLWKVRITGNHTILTAGFQAFENGVIWVGDTTITGGIVTGKRYAIDTGGQIYGKALETLPGDVAGTWTSGIKNITGDLLISGNHYQDNPYIRTDHASGIIFTNKAGTDYTSVSGRTFWSGAFAALTSNLIAYECDVTWNNAAVNFRAVKYNVNVTAAGADSRILSLHSSGVVKWQCRPDGSVIWSPPASITPPSNGDMAIEATSNTLTTIRMKGSDGTVRAGGIQLGGPLTGVVTVSTSAPSGGNDGDVWYQYT